MVALHHSSMGSQDRRGRRSLQENCHLERSEAESKDPFPLKNGFFDYGLSPSAQNDIPFVEGGFPVPMLQPCKWCRPYKFIKLHAKIATHLGGDFVRLISP